MNKHETKKAVPEIKNIGKEMFSDGLKALLEDKELSVKKAGNITGLSPYVINNWLQSSTRPTESQIKQFDNGLGSNLAERYQGWFRPDKKSQAEPGTEIPDIEIPRPEQISALPVAEAVALLQGILDCLKIILDREAISQN